MPTADEGESTDSGHAPEHQHAGPRQEAAEQVVERLSFPIWVPVLGKVCIPRPQHLAWYAGVGALAALEVIDWPVALILAAGKALADNHSSDTLREFGQALDQAA